MRQPEQLGLGHAILCAERAVGSESFAVLLADDFLIAEDDNVVSDLIIKHKNSGKTQLSVMGVQGSDISKYGIIVPGDVDGSVSGLVEKPNLSQAPSNLASVGRYILNSDIFDILRHQAVGLGGEIQLADALNILAKKGNVEAVELNALRFDCGSIEGYLDAIRYVSANS